MSPSANTAIQSSPELFDVRMKIVQHTNPLRAKAIIFSVIYRAIEFSSRDWVTLKSKELDVLIRHLHSSCETLIELKEKLDRAARKIDSENEEKNLETVRIIIKYMQRLYNEQSYTDTTENDFDASSFSQEDDTTQLFDFSDPKPELEPTAPPLSSDLEQQWNHADQTQSIDFEDNERTIGTISYDGSEEVSDVNLRALDETLEPSMRSAQNSVNHLGGEAQTYPLKPVSESETDASLELSQPPIITDNLNIAGSLMERMDLEEEIHHLVAKRAKTVMVVLQNAIQQVEAELEQQLLVQEPRQDRLSLKYQALKELTDKVQTHLSKVRRILEQQEHSCLGLSQNPDSTDEVESPIVEKEPNVQVSPNPAIPKAILALFNPILNSRGITPLATLHERCLHIVLESEKELNPQKIVEFVQKKIVDLDLTAVELVKVHGRKPGNQSLDWTQVIHPPSE